MVILSRFLQPSSTLLQVLRDTFTRHISYSPFYTKQPLMASFMPTTDLLSRLPLLIDTDCGIDDAQALIAALRDTKRTNILAITTVSGNTSVKNATLNVCACLEATDRTDVLVYEGCHRPIVEPIREAATWHCEDGLGGTFLGI